MESAAVRTGCSTLAYVLERDFLAVEFLGGTEREILHQKPVHLVPIGSCFILLPQLPLNKRPKTLLTRIENFGAYLAELISEQILVGMPLSQFKSRSKIAHESAERGGNSPVWMRQRREVKFHCDRRVQGIGKCRLSP